MHVGHALVVRSERPRTGSPRIPRTPPQPQTFEGTRPDRYHLHARQPTPLTVTHNRPHHRRSGLPPMAPRSSIIIPFIARPHSATSPTVYVPAGLTNGSLIAHANASVPARSNDVFATSNGPSSGDHALREADAYVTVRPTVFR